MECKIVAAGGPKNPLPTKVNWGMFLSVEECGEVRIKV